MRKKVTVIGGTGLVGRYLQQALQDHGCRINIISRFPNINANTQVPSGHNKISRDISRTDWIEGIETELLSSDLIYFLAYSATSGDESYDFDVTVRALQILLNFLDANDWGIDKHLLYLGSIAVFAENSDNTAYEIDELSARTKATVYASMKLNACESLKNQEYRFRRTILHPTGIYDESSKRIRMYQEITKHHRIQFINGGQGLNLIIHAQDVAKAMVAASSRSGSLYDEFLINGEEILYKRWVKEIEISAGITAFQRWLEKTIDAMPFSTLIIRILKKLRFRVRHYGQLPLYKLHSFESKRSINCSHAIQGFGFTPQIKFSATSLNTYVEGSKEKA